jgi:hypothetical protein
LRTVLDIGAIIERTILEAAGFHRNNRGPWRKKRMATETPTTTDLTAAPASLAAVLPEPSPAALAPTKAERRALVVIDNRSLKEVAAAVKSGELSITQIREMFKGAPDGVLGLLGSTARHAEDALIHAGHGEDLLIVEAVREKMSRVAKEPAGADATASERLLAERAAFAWVAVNIYETKLAQAEGLTITQVLFQQRRIDLAHRRFLSTMKALAAIRRQPAPGVRVDVRQSRTIEGTTAAAERETPCIDRRIAGEPGGGAGLIGPGDFVSFVLLSRFAWRSETPRFC